MLRFRPYRAGDVAAIEIAGEGKVPPSVDALAQEAWSHTAVAFGGLGRSLASPVSPPSEAGIIIACGGILRVEPHRGVAWALFARGLPLRVMVRLRRRCRAALKLAEADGFHCLEAEVAKDFIGGHEFAGALGFRFAGPCAGRLAGGAPMFRYVRSPYWNEVPPRVRACLALAADSLRHHLVLREAA